MSSATAPTTDTTHTTATESPRARLRRQVQQQITAIAWDLLAEDGLDAVSIAAIASRLQLTPPALYRYVDDRDEVVTRLRGRAAEELADAVVAAAGSSSGPDRFVAIALAVRAWAVAHRHAYLLALGDATDAADVPVTVAAAQARALDAVAREPGARPRPRPAARVAADRQRAWALWTRTHGVVLLELTGHLHVTGDEDAAATHLAREAAAAF